MHFDEVLIKAIDDGNKRARKKLQEKVLIMKLHSIKLVLSVSAKQDMLVVKLALLEINMLIIKQELFSIEGVLKMFIIKQEEFIIVLKAITGRQSRQELLIVLLAK